MMRCIGDRRVSGFNFPDMLTLLGRSSNWPIDFLGARELFLCYCLSVHHVFHPHERTIKPDEKYV